MDYLKKQLQSAGWMFEDVENREQVQAGVYSGDPESIRKAAQWQREAMAGVAGTPENAQTGKTKDAIEKLYAAILTGDRARATAILHSNKRK
jgi:phytoene/squalene synthetase